MSNPYDSKKYYTSKAKEKNLGHLVGKIGFVLKAMVADATEEGEVIIDGIFYKAKALENVDAFDSVMVVGVNNQILHIRKFVVDVENASLSYLANLNIPLSTLMPTEYPLPSAQITSLQNIRLLTASDIVTVNNLLNPHPVSLSSIPNPSNLDVALSTRLKPADLNLDGDKDLQVDVKSLPTITQSTKHDGKTYKSAVFNSSSSGNLVSAVSGKVIKLHAMVVQAQGTVTVTLTNGNGGATIIAPFKLQDREGVVLPLASAPAFWAKTSTNTALYVNLSASVTVTITAIYSDDDAS